MKIYIGYECCSAPDSYARIITTDKEKAIEKMKDVSKDCYTSDSLTVMEYEDGDGDEMGKEIFKINGKYKDKGRKFKSR